MPSRDNTILLIEDEKDLADLYKKWIPSKYDVKVVYNVENAVDLIKSMQDEIEIVLVDRLMPGMRGDKVVDTIVSEDLIGGTAVAMITGVDPEESILSMDIDSYIKKPIDKPRLINEIERLSGVTSYDDTARELLSLINKKEAIINNENELGDQTLVEIDSRIDMMRRHLDSQASTDVLLEFLLDEAGDSLESVIQYNDQSWDFRYLTEETESIFNSFTDLDEFINSLKRSGCEIRKVDEILEVGGYYCTLNLFQELAFLQFHNEEDNSEESGIILVFDINAVSNLTGFVSDIYPELEKSGFVHEESKPDW